MSQQEFQNKPRLEQYLILYISVLKKYVQFSGRACRKEFWSFVLVSLTVVAILAMIFKYDNMIVDLYSLAIFLPAMAVSIRRLHDTNRSGYWILLHLVPVIGSIVLLVYFLQDSQEEDNSYGPNPLSC